MVLLIVGSLIYNLDLNFAAVIGILLMTIALIGFSIETKRILDKIENLDEKHMKDLIVGYTLLIVLAAITFSFETLGILAEWGYLIIYILAILPLFGMFNGIIAIIIAINNHNKKASSMKLLIQILGILIALITLVINLS